MTVWIIKAWKEQDKNPGDCNGETPLHYAATKGQFETCEMILKNVVNKNPANNFGETILHRAAFVAELSLHYISSIFIIWYFRYITT